MSLEMIERLLKMLSMLTNQGSFTVEELTERLSIGRRMVYRYIEWFDAMGFDVVKQGKRYSISPQSPYIREFIQGIRFSEDEALTMLHVLNSVNNRAPEVRHLREKLSTLYDKNILSHHSVDEHVASNLAVLYEAVKSEQLVCLKGYCSPSSGCVSDRIVEPFLFLAGNTEVRCYEVATQMNKTFKIARAQSVELIDLKWSYKVFHASPKTDVFHFTGETTTLVVLRLGALAKNVLLEECPLAEPFLTHLGDENYRLDVEVCSFKGIGRFVLGLFEDIEVLCNDEFKDYLRERISQMIARSEWT